VVVATHVTASAMTRPLATRRVNKLFLMPPSVGTTIDAAPFGKLRIVSA